MGGNEGEGIPGGQKNMSYDRGAGQKSSLTRLDLRLHEGSDSYYIIIFDTHRYFLKLPGPAVSLCLI